MAINPALKYPGQTKSPDVSYLYGSARDDTNPNNPSGDGTPLQKDWVNDIFGLQQALLAEAGIVPNGNSDTVQNSQYLEAIKKIIDLKSNPMFEYNVPLDGETNSLSEFQALFSHLNEKQIPFKGIPGTYVLSGTGNIEIQVSADFTGMIFDVEDWNGEFKILRAEDPVTYTAGDGGIGDDVINAYIGSTTLDNSSSYIDGWANRTECDDAFIKVNTDQDLYQYRSTIYKRVEYNHCWHKGVLNSPFKYDMNGVNVTSIEVLPLEKQKKKIVGLTINLGQNDLKTAFVRVQTSRTDVEVKFLNSELYQTNSLPQLVFIQDSAYIYLDIICQNAMQGDQVPVAYAFGTSRCYDLTIKAQCDGDGWGCNATNETRRLTFKESNLNRIDCHRPFYEFLKVENCNLGEKALEIVGAGDVILKNNTLKLDSLTYFDGAATLILGRADTGGWIDGDLIIDDLRIETSHTSFNMFLNQQTTEGEREILAPPVGSPINFRFFRDIKINNLYTHGGDAQVTCTIEPTLIEREGNMLLKPCRSFTLTNSKNLRAYIKFNLNGLIPEPTTHIYDLVTHIENSSIHILDINDNSDAFKVKHFGQNCTPFDNNFSSYNMTAAGDYHFNSCQNHVLNFLTNRFLVGERLRAHSNYTIQAETFNFTTLDLNVGDVIQLSARFTRPDTEFLNLTGYYKILGISASVITLDVPNSNDQADWDTIATAYAPDNNTEYAECDIELQVRTANKLFVELNSHIFEHRAAIIAETISEEVSEIVSDFLPRKLDNVYLTMVGGKASSPDSGRLQHMFLEEKYRFIGTQFLVDGVTPFLPRFANNQLIAAEYFIEKQIEADQESPHQFAAEGIFEETNTQTALFALVKNQYVNVELEFVNELNVEGTIAAYVLFEGTNDDGATFTTYASLQMGYISTTNGTFVGKKAVHTRKQFLSRNVYEKYRATVYLRCSVDAGTSFPLSQGSSEYDGEEIRLHINYI